MSKEPILIFVMLAPTRKKMTTIEITRIKYLLYVITFGSSPALMSLTWAVWGALGEQRVRLIGFTFLGARIYIQL